MSRTSYARASRTTAPRLVPNGCGSEPAHNGSVRDPGQAVRRPARGPGPGREEGLIDGIGLSNVSRRHLRRGDPAYALGDPCHAYTPDPWSASATHRRYPYGGLSRPGREPGARHDGQPRFACPDR
jgi:hypothetical protein